MKWSRQNGETFASRLLRGGGSLEAAETLSILFSVCGVLDASSSPTEGVLRLYEALLFALSVSRAFSISGGDNSKFRSEEHTSELQSHSDLVCRLLLGKKKTKLRATTPCSVHFTCHATRVLVDL